MHIQDLLRVVRNNPFSDYDWGEEAVMFFNLKLPKEHHLTVSSTGEDALVSLFNLKSAEYTSLMEMIVDISSGRFEAVSPSPTVPTDPVGIPNLTPTTDHIPMHGNGSNHYNYGLPATAPVVIDSNEPPAIGWTPIVVAGGVAVLLFGLVIFAISGNPSGDPKSHNFVRRAVGWVLDSMQTSHDRAESVPDTPTDPVTEPYIEPVYPAPVEPYYPPPPPPVPQYPRQSPRAIPPQNPQTEPESESQKLRL